jgi:hypothetical protein
MMTTGSPVPAPCLARCLALKALYALDAARTGAWAWRRTVQGEWTQLSPLLCPAAGPILFLASLCVVAAGLFALVDGVPALVFLSAGCAAVGAYLVLLRRSAADPRPVRAGQGPGPADLV